MAIKASNQVDLIDLTDGYSVILTNENYTFLGTTDSVDGTQSTTVQIMALRGAEQIACEVGEIATPNGISAVSDGKPPSPTIAITATSALKTSGSITIPVEIGDITINKIFSYSIAFKGENGTSVTITNQSVTYQIGTSGTTAPTGNWTTTIPTPGANQYLWTKTEVTYSDGKKTVAYSVSRNPSDGTDGNDGTSVTVSSSSTTYQVSANGTTPPTGTWSSTIPTVPQGQYLWTRTIVNYSDGKSTTSYSVSRAGVDGSDGADGEDAINLVVTSSNGLIFKNTAIATVLTAHIYKGGLEVTGSALTALGTIKWYKDGATSSMATGQTLTITAGDVSDKATYVAQLEG